MDIKQQLARITTLVEQWDGLPSTLERDLVLEKLRALYDAVAQAREEQKPKSAARMATPEPEPMPQEPEPALRPADLFDAAPPLPPVVDPATKPAAKPAPKAAAGRIDKKTILSLYGEGESKPAAEGSSRVLGEVLQQPAGDVAGRVAASLARDLRSAIGINDKFLIISEVFGGSAPAYEQAIDDLDAFTDLNEAMIHIHDTYDWNPRNEGVKTLVEILTRKLS